MNRITVIISLLTVTYAFVFGQISTDSVSMKKVFGGYHFIKVRKE